MAQLIQKYIAKDTQMKIATAAPSGTFVIGETIGNNAVQGSATFLATLKEIIGAGAATIFVVDNIRGTALPADAATLTGYTSTFTAAVDTVADVGGFVLNGADLHITSRGLEKHTYTSNGRKVEEVLFAIKSFSTKQAA